MGHYQPKYSSIALASILLMFIHLSVPARFVGSNENDSLSVSYVACLYVDGHAIGIRIDQPFAMHSIMNMPSLSKEVMAVGLELMRQFLQE